MKRTKAEKGITLVALIITIIVLLILAVVAIRAVQGEGIIAKAKKAKNTHTEAEQNENDIFEEYEYKLEASTVFANSDEYNNYYISKFQKSGETCIALKLTDFNIDETNQTTFLKTDLENYNEILNAKAVILPYG